MYVSNKSFMLSEIMLSIVMLSAANKSFMLCVIMLSVIMLSVVYADCRK